MIEPIIRPAILDDAAQLALVRVLAWQAAYRDILPADFLHAMNVQSDERRWRDLMNRDGRQDIVCTSNGEIAGYATFGPSRDGAAATTAKVSKSAGVSVSSTGVRAYATEAARAALDFGFGPLGLKEIISFTVPANLRSRRVMERIGMTRSPADDFDHPRLPEGHPLRRHVLYRLRRSETS